MSTGRCFTITDFKPPWDSFFASVDCSAWLDSDTINTVTFTAKDSDGNDVSSTVLDQSKCTFTDTTLKPYIQAGTDETQYDVIMKAVTDAGDQLSAQVTFYCKDF